MLLSSAIKRALKRRLYRIRRQAVTKCIGERIRRVDSRNIPPNNGELRMFITVRNESLRLPFIIDHYFSRGVDRCFVIDNGSTDDTPQIVLSHDRSHLFHTADAYAHQGHWIDHLLRRYGEGGWSLIVDADEVLVYPDSEALPLKSLCLRMQDEGYNALDAVLLDMYPSIPLRSFQYRQGEDPSKYARFFDSGPYDTSLEGVRDLADSGVDIVYEGPPRLVGGMRQRVFGTVPCISKFPLVRFQRSMFLSAGTHWIDGACVAPMRAALLHYKYLSDFEENVRLEASRGAHWNNASEYKAYFAAVEGKDDFSFYSPSSTEYLGPEQLLALGIMKSTMHGERHDTNISFGAASSSQRSRRHSLL
jgi:glycosyltransferase involved in cell wall biosynthesis